MNRSILNRSGARTWRCAMLAGLMMLSWALPVTGGEKQLIQCVAIAVGGSPGEIKVTPGGTVHIKGLGAVYMMLSDNPLINGRLTVTGNFNGDLELNGVASGSGLFEIGTWDLSSGMPVFEAAADGAYYTSRWEFKGLLAAEGSLKAVGHGIAGAVDGLVYVVEGTTAWDDFFGM
jgi:hypothetical protein